MENITEMVQDFKSFEINLYETMCKIACEQIEQYLSWLDLNILGIRDTSEYRNVGIRETTIKTVFGEVSYKRRYYKDTRSGEHVFLLDKAMGIGGEYGLVSENLAEQIVHECAEKSFRKSASTISNNTGQSISPMGVWNIVQRYGEVIAKQVDRLAELDDSGSSGHLGGIATRVLFNEYDDVYIPRQREQRRKSGEAAKGAKKIGKKLGKLPMHVGVAYTGWAEGTGGRSNTANKIAYASFGKVPDFIDKFEALLNNRFDMDRVRIRITNGDGEQWIRTAAANSGSILQLDPFHRSQAIFRAVSDKTQRKRILDAVNGKDVQKVLDTICDMILETQEETSIKKLAKLYGYFNSNIDSFLTWQERGMELPTPPKGIAYRGMGVQESSNCLITQRMKNRRGSWSEKGANNMASILSFRGTIGLDAILGELPEPEPTHPFAEPLSVAKAPLHDGKGYGADWLNAQMPIEKAFRTNGREAIINLVRMKPISEMSFI